jgi:hypothetical protein
MTQTAMAAAAGDFGWEGRELSRVGFGLWPVVRQEEGGGALGGGVAARGDLVGSCLYRSTYSICKA